MKVKNWIPKMIFLKKSNLRYQNSETEPTQVILKSKNNLMHRKTPHPGLTHS